jgi:predicted MPP superfamily phosphohydrolase
MSELAKIAPLYGVGGNHDSRSGTRRDIFAGTNMVELSGEGRFLEIKGNQVWINGVSVDKEAAIQKNFSPPPKDTFSIFLYHYPTGVGLATKHNIDLFCTGHTHGGQVRLPLYGALITMSPLGKKYEYGLYKEGKTNVFVSRGVGMTALPIRFLAPPEIAVLDIRGVKLNQKSDGN